MKPFNRYDDAPEEKVVTMPADILDASTSNTMIMEVVGRFEDYSQDPDKFHARYPWASRFIMGYPLPSWQRPLVWTDEQMVRFITSIWEGVDIGSYLLNDIYEFLKAPDGSFAKQDDHLVMRELSDVLLDGQQRLFAIQQYITNVFPVPDSEGVPRYWRELGRFERRRFLGYTFARSTIATWDEALLRKAYDLRAFGGTAHKDSERASV